jgi:hypothetical protein
VVALLVASLAPLFVCLMRGDKWGDYYGQKLAAVWIKAHADAAHAPRIMSTVPVTAFYASGEHIALPDEDYADFIAHARAARVDFIIINERDIRHTRLKFLLDETSQHPELRLVYRCDVPPGFRTLVYTLSDS